VLTGAIVVASTNASGAVVTGNSFASHIIDGTKALFYTTGALVSDDTNGKEDVYVRTLSW
jgi:hypothetical protein